MPLTHAEQLERFPAHYMELYKKAAIEAQRITLDSEKKAIRLRYQLYQFRKALRGRYKHEHVGEAEVTIANQVQFRIEPGPARIIGEGEEGDPVEWYLIAEPVDDGFADLLEEHGIVANMQLPNLEDI